MYDVKLLLKDAGAVTISGYGEVAAAAQVLELGRFESDDGVGIAGDIPMGPCTLFRLGGERLDHLFIREGEMVDRDIREDLCRTQVRMAVDGPVDELLSAPLGNHHVLIAGHHRHTIERFFNRYLAA